MITKIARSYVLLKYGDRVAHVGGEMLTTQPGMSDYLLYKSSVRWEPPLKDEAVNDVARNRILEQIVLELAKKGWKAEIV